MLRESVKKVYMVAGVIIVSGRSALSHAVTVAPGHALVSVTTHLNPAAVLPVTEKLLKLKPVMSTFAQTS
jgi:hypothetical protein